RGLVVGTGLFQVRREIIHRIGHAPETLGKLLHTFLEALEVLLVRFTEVGLAQLEVRDLLAVLVPQRITGAANAAGNRAQLAVIRPDPGHAILLSARSASSPASGPPARDHTAGATRTRMSINAPILAGPIGSSRRFGQSSCAANGARCHQK